MESIDLLIDARWVIPVEPDQRVLERHALAVQQRPYHRAAAGVRSTGALCRPRVSAASASRADPGIRQRSHPRRHEPVAGHCRRFAARAPGSASASGHSSSAGSAPNLCATAASSPSPKCCSAVRPVSPTGTSILRKVRRWQRTCTCAPASARLLPMRRHPGRAARKTICRGDSSCTMPGATIHSSPPPWGHTLHIWYPMQPSSASAPMPMSSTHW